MYSLTNGIAPSFYFGITSRKKANINPKKSNHPNYSELCARLSEFFKYNHP
uniref:Uncharacterized protein n=1 Tax=Rhizophora mucronata TaxID=61149 RepID=A0A2P2NC64_RHIMU